MNNNSETKNIFTCPQCSGKFKALFMEEPKAYKCPSCKGTVTVFSDGSVRLGDLTKKLESPQAKESLEMLDRISKGLVGEQEVDETVLAEEEKKLFSEIMEQMKEIKTKQDKAVKEFSADEFRKLRDENSILKEKIRGMQNDLRDLRSGSEKGITSTPRENLEAQLQQLRNRIQSQAEIISNLNKEKDELETMLTERASNRDRSDLFAQLGQTQAMLDQREEETNEKEISLDRREKELSDLTAKVDMERSSNEEFRKELDQYQAKLENRAIGLANEKEELEKIKMEYAHVQDLAEKLQVKERDMDERENNLHDMEKDLMVSRGNLRQTEMMIGVLQERERVLTIREKGLDEREKALEKSNRDLSELKKNLVTRAKELKQREDSSKLLESGLQKREEALRSASEKWKTFARQLEEYKKELGRSSEELQEWEERLTEREEKLQTAREKLKTLKAMMTQGIVTEKDKTTSGKSEEELAKEIESKKEGLQNVENKLKNILD